MRMVKVGEAKASLRLLAACHALFRPVLPFKFAFARYFLRKEQLAVLVVALDRKWKAEAQNWTPSCLEHVCMRFNRFPWFNELKCFILIGRNITIFFFCKIPTQQ